MLQKSERPVVIWLLIGCFLIASMVIIGGITRLTHSGLSMVEWKLIMGTIPPLNDAQWIETFEKYKQFPEYKIMHSYFTLEDFKSIFMWEYLHRLLGRVLGLVFIIPFVIFLVKGKISKVLLPKLLLVFVWGGFQGFLGWFMVKSGLVNNPNVSHYRLAIHLVTAFGLCCYIYWVVLELVKVNGKKSLGTSFKKWAVFLLVISFIQVIYGAFVAGLKAGFIYTTWPKMGTHWIDPSVGDAISNKGIMALVNDPVSVQFVHRWLAILVLFVVVYIIVRANRVTLTVAQRKAKNVLLFFALLQVVLGVATLVLAVPIVLGVAHQLVALLFLMGVTNLVYHFRKA